MTIVAVEASLARLDRAVSRLERAMRAGEQVRASHDQAFHRLDSRHDLLRARVAETIARLDGLIAEGVRDGAAG